MKIKVTFEKIEKTLSKTVLFFSKANLEDFSKAYVKTLKKLPRISHLRNIVLFSLIGSLIIFVLFAERFSALYQYLPQKPIKGGFFVEGTVGEIAQFNPLFTPVNPAEDSVSSLLFSGLTQNISDRNVVGNLAESWEISEDKKTYTFKLRDNLFWHDGDLLDSSDVLFTFNTIQNPDANSPRLATWKDVVVKAPDERTVSFLLPNPLASFIYLTDVPIVPEHILKEVSVSNLRAAEFSLKPIGSGPFVFSEFKQVKDVQQVSLKANEKYHKGRPFINEVVVKAFPNYRSLTQAYNQRDVMSVSRLRPYDVGREGHLPNIEAKNLAIPEYSALFFNLRAEKLKDENLRSAISFVVDKKKIVEEVYSGEAIPIHSAILPGYLGYNSDIEQKFDPELAKKKLSDSGYVISAGGKLQKNNTDISLRLVSLDDDLQRKKAELLAEMIRALGITVNIESYPLRTYIEEMIRPRNFDLLLVAKNLGPDSDIYTFYHANMDDDPGLNLSGIKNREIDKHLENARKSHDLDSRAKRYSEVSRLINEANIASFICWPGHLYGISREVRGVGPFRIVNPRDRFWNIEDWYIYSERDY